MKFRTIKTAAILMLAGVVLTQSGCGSSSPNVVTVSVYPPAATVIAGTVQTFSATVTGASSGVTTSTFTCQYQYTPLPTTAVPNPQPTALQNCTSGQTVNGGSIGTWTSTPTAATNVLTYTAPALANFPNPIPTLTFTAAATAATNKKGTAIVALDTGIRASVTPLTVTVPVGLNPAQQVQFTAAFLNVPPVNPPPTWSVQQPVAGDTTDFPPSGTATPAGASCSPACGTISAQGVFTAPATMPTDTHPKSSGSNASTAAPIVTVVVNSPNDTVHYALATITLVNASTNPLTFTGIHPTTIAAGGVEQDIYLDAKNILNTTTITFTPPGANQQPQVINPSEVFTIPITAAYCTPSATGVTPVVTCDASIMTRIRLNTSQLATAGTGLITVNNIPSGVTATPPCTLTSGSGNTVSISCPIDLVYASPAVVSAVPDYYTQGSNTEFSTDGGYYGGGNFPIVELLFNGNLNVATAFSARQFTGPLQGSQTQSPGLYPVSIVWNAPTLAPPFNPPPYPVVSSNVAVQPVFANLASVYSPTTTPPPPQVYPPNIGLLGGANAMPSSMALNSAKGYAVITEQGANAVEIVNLVPNPGLSGRHIPQVGIQVPVGNQPTGVAIDSQIDLTAAGFPGQDLGVVVNSGNPGSSTINDNSLTLLALPSGKQIGTPISLAGLFSESTGATPQPNCPPGTTSCQPSPFSVGVDPITHYAVVAFSNSFVGFIVDVNPNPTTQPPTCFVSTQKAPCALAAVSLNTGSSPQVIMQPDVPLAYVTPGGAGVTSVVNLLLTNNVVSIAAAPNGAVRTNNVVTITTPTANNLNQSSPGTVLVAGVTPADLNGTFNVTSATTYTFTYTQSGVNETGGGGTVTYGNPYYTFSTTATAVGGAINPVTRTFAFADPNASTAAPQIGFIAGLDQTVSSLYLTRGSCNSCTPVTTAPEVGVRYVDWDPYTDVLIAYNPQPLYDEISLINPGGQAIAGQSGAYRIIEAIPTGQNGQGSFTPTGATAPVTVTGAMVYDPKTNLVLTANAGSNTLTYLDLDPTSTFKQVSLHDVQLQLTPWNSATKSNPNGGVPSSQPPLASAPNAPNPLPTAICDPTLPTNIYATCMPHAVTVGQPALLRVLGQGFLSGGAPTVQLDGSSTGISITSATDSEVDITIAASRLARAHDFALTVLSGGVTSNTQDLYAVGLIDLSNQCGTTAAMPEAVAIDYIQNVAAVTSYGCGTLTFISVDSTNAHNYGVPYGAVLATVNVGKNPIGVDVIPRLGYAVTANNGEGSASIVQYGGNPFKATQLAFTSTNCIVSSGTATTSNICVGVSPTGVTIDQDRALALIANTGGNSLSAIDMTVLTQATSKCTDTTIGTSGTCIPPMQLIPTSGPPTAIAIDDNRAEAVVTNLQNSGTTLITGGLDVISLAAVPPTKSSTSSINTLSANPTGIVNDPAISPDLFYVTSTQQNAIYSFNPDTSTTSLIRVGINPYSIAYNYQTGTMMSVNSTSGTSSVIDAVNAPVFATRETLGISSQSQFAATIDNFTNTAVMADQNNNRVLILPMPK